MSKELRSRPVFSESAAKNMAEDVRLDLAGLPGGNTEEQELLDIAIDLGDGREEHIVVYEGDKAEDVADGFCSKHQLTDRQRTQLASQIRDAMFEEQKSRTLHSQKPLEAVAKNDETVSENVDDDDDISEHSHAGNVVNKVPVMETKLYSRAVGRKSLINNPVSSPFKAGHASSALPKGESRSEASRKCKAPAAKKGASAATTSGTMTVRPFAGDRAGEEARAVEIEGRFKRGASVGDFGKATGLYERGMKTKASLQKQVVDKEKERKQKEMEGVTFKPKINRANKYLKNRGLQKRKTEERLMEHIKKVQEKQEIIKKAANKEGAAQCTFRPEINKKSAAMAHEQILMRTKTLSSSRSCKNKFDQLFEDAKRRKALETKRIKMIPDCECTFAPNTELTQEFNLSGLGQKKLLGRTSERKPKSSKNVSSAIDSQTGRVLFVPTIGREPKKRSKSKGESIGDYLYSHRERKEHSQERGQEASHSVSMVHERSSQLVEKMRKECFANIFGILDSDGDGLISSANVNVGGLTQEVCEIYLPLLREMEEMKCNLSVEEFTDASNNLFKELSMSQRNDLISFHKSLGVSHSSRSLSSCESYSFKPEIGQKSRELAKKTSFHGVDLPTKLLQMQILTRIKLEKQRKVKEDSQLEGCSFRPEIHQMKESIYSQREQGESQYTSPIRELYGKLLEHDINKSFEEPDDS